MTVSCGHHILRGMEVAVFMPKVLLVKYGRGATCVNIMADEMIALFKTMHGATDVSYSIKYNIRT